MDDPCPGGGRLVGAPRSVGAAVWSARVAVLALLAILLTACPQSEPRRPSLVREPAAIGIVAEVEEIDGGGLAVRLEDGRRVTIATEATHLAARLPGPGDLLLLGAAEESGWFAAIRDTELGYYALNGAHCGLVFKTWDTGRRVTEMPPA